MTTGITPSLAGWLKPSEAEALRAELEKAKAEIAVRGDRLREVDWLTRMAGVRVGDHVLKDGGDYRFDGHVVSVFTKLSGAVRVAVENGDGILHIFSGGSLKKLLAGPPSSGPATEAPL